MDASMTPDNSKISDTQGDQEKVPGDALNPSPEVDALGRSPHPGHKFQGEAAIADQTEMAAPDGRDNATPVGSPRGLDSVFQTPDPGKLTPDSTILGTDTGAEAERGQ